MRDYTHFRRSVSVLWINIFYESEYNLSKSMDPDSLKVLVRRLQSQGYNLGVTVQWSQSEDNTPKVTVQGLQSIK